MYARDNSMKLAEKTPPASIKRNRRYRAFSSGAIFLAVERTARKNGTIPKPAFAETYARSTQPEAAASRMHKSDKTTLLATARRGNAS